jgi:perosamine synthetase
MRCSKPSITALEKKFVNEALNVGDIGVGKFISKFENSWAAWNHKKYGVSCNSGTNAIYLALKALGIGPGDEVLVPEFTMVATAWAVTYTGAKPVFVDCGDDLNMLDNFKVTKKTKAIIPVPIYGRAVKSSVYSKARKNKLFIVEDMAEAHGIPPKGDIACYSFYGNKILTTGEGGMCLTNNKKWADEMRKYANMYFDKNRTLLHPKVGHNFRLTNIQAAIGCAQVLRAKEIISKRKKIESWYDKYLPQDMLMPKRDVLWVYDIDCGKRQEEIKRKLGNIESRYFFKPMSMQPMYLGKYKHLNAYKWSKRGLYLPTFTDMTQEDVKRVCKTLETIVNAKK